MNFVTNSSPRVSQFGLMNKAVYQTGLTVEQMNRPFPELIEKVEVHAEIVGINPVRFAAMLKSILLGNTDVSNDRRDVYRPILKGN